MRVVLALGLLALAAAPVAQACSYASPTQPFDQIHWTSASHLEFNEDRASSWSVDVSTQGWTRRESTDVDRRPAPAPPATVTDPSGRFRLEPVPYGTTCSIPADGEGRCAPNGLGMSNSCLPDARYHVGTALMDGTRPIRQWIGQPMLFAQSWANATHGFVWEPDNSTLHVVTWATGSVQSTAFDVAGAGPTHFGHPLLVEGRLVLTGLGLVALVDPGRPSASLHRVGPAAYPSMHGETAFFAKAEDGLAHAALLDLRDGSTVWNVTAAGTQVHWAPFGPVVIDEAEGSILPFWGNETQPPVRFQPASVRASSSDEGIAIGIRTEAPRLVVLDATGAVVLDQTLDREAGA